MTESKAHERDPAEAAGLLARSASGIIALGVVTAIAGVAIVAWPDATLKVIAVVFGVSALVTGVFRLVSAIAAGDRGGGSRVLLALLGVVSIVVGLLVLRHPFQTLAALALLFGLFCVISGAVELVHALGSPEMSGRGWAIGAGVVTLAAGIVLLTYTTASLLVLTWLLGAQLLLSGASLVGWGVSIRQSDRRATEAASAHHMPRHA